VTYGELQELANHPEDGEQSHWIVNEDIDLNDSDECIELVQTGSVTTKINGKRYVIFLSVQEAK
jgi:hypothetical protein